jgi:hypothetical protein
VSGGAAQGPVTSGSHRRSTTCVGREVVGWFPVAMLVMAGSFGLWRAEIFSTASFAAGVTAMVLLLLGTATWASDGFWAADGGYAR